MILSHGKAITNRDGQAMRNYLSIRYIYIYIQSIIEYSEFDEYAANL